MCFFFVPGAARASRCSSSRWRCATGAIHAGQSEGLGDGPLGTVPGAVVTLQRAGARPSSHHQQPGALLLRRADAGRLGITAQKTGFAVYQMQAFPVSGDGSIDIQLSVATESQEVTVSDDNTHVEVDPDRNAMQNV